MSNEEKRAKRRTRLLAVSKGREPRFFLSEKRKLLRIEKREKLIFVYW